MGGTVISAGIVVVDHVAAIARLPAAGELVLTDSCGLHIGGCAANVALNLARLGIETKMLGAVGDDAFGNFAHQVLADRGVDTRELVRFSVPTSQTLVVNVAGEDRRFIHLPGANDLFRADRIAETSRVGTRVLYVGGMFLMAGLEAGELAPVFAQARKEGIITILDVVTPGPKDYLTPLTALLPHTDFFLPNEDEGKLMSGIADAKEQARFFQTLGATNVIITRGRHGAIGATHDGVWELGAYDVPFVDGTGGGDAFVAGLISGLINDNSLIESLERASALGASCVRAVGATEGVFHAAELEQFLRANQLRRQWLPTPSP